MSAFSGVNIRNTDAYWILSGPLPCNRISSCRACKGMIPKGTMVMVRDGRKLRFMYHQSCFTGDADPRTQQGSSYDVKPEYHKSTAPKLSSLEGPTAYKDKDGRALGRSVFKNTAPSNIGEGKWSVRERGYHPKLT